MTYSLAVCARTACVDVLAVREVALCVKYAGRLFILTPL
jgi:hypothetical protein